MRIQVISDLHNEVQRHEQGGDPPDLPDVGADVVVLAGDIDRGCRGVTWAAEQAKRLDAPVIYVPGNHEFYHGCYPATLEAMRDAALGTWVHVLDCDSAVLGGVRFLGAVLWTDFAGDGRVSAAQAMPVAGAQMPDYHYIRVASGQRLLCPEDTRARHYQSREWLYRNLVAEGSEPRVVVTHTPPLLDCAHPDHPLDALGAAFVSDLHPLLEATGPWLWIHGHTHANTDLYYCGVRVLSNQHGYPGEAVPGAPFDATTVVEIDTPDGGA